MIAVVWSRSRAQRGIDRSPSSCSAAAQIVDLVAQYRISSIPMMMPCLLGLEHFNKEKNLPELEVLAALEGKLLLLLADGALL